MLDSITLKIPHLDKLTDQEFFRFCQDHRDLKIERTHNYEIILMSPTSYESGRIENEIQWQLTSWNKVSKSGEVLSPSTGFSLPDGSVFSPVVAWVSKQKDHNLSASERDTFPHLCPDFVIELRSKSDSVGVLKEKMKRWILNGCELAFLIDPFTHTSWIFRKNGEVEQVDGFENSLSGEETLPGFSLDLNSL